MGLWVLIALMMVVLMAAVIALGFALDSPQYQDPNALGMNLVVLLMGVGLNLATAAVAATLLLGAYRLYFQKSLGLVRLAAALAIVAPPLFTFGACFGGCGCTGFFIWLPLSAISIAAGVGALIVSLDPEVVAGFEDLEATPL